MCYSIHYYPLKELLDHGVMMNKYKEWPTITYPGVVAFCIPPSATQRLIDDKTTICVTDAGTDVLASLFPLRQSSSASMASLELELRDFTNRCVRNVVDVATESYEHPCDVDFPGIVCCQSVLTIDPDRVWIARAYARDGGDNFLLIHWNGDREISTTFLLPLLVSLVPLFAIQNGG